MTVDLANWEIVATACGPVRRSMITHWRLPNGHDDISPTPRHADRIADFEAFSRYGTHHAVTGTEGKRVSGARAIWRGCHGPNGA